MNQDTITKWFQEGLNNGNTQIACDIFADDFTYHGASGTMNLSAFLDRVTEIRKNNASLRYEVDFMTSYGERVGVAWTANGKKGVGVADFESGKCVALTGVMADL